MKKTLLTSIICLSAASLFADEIPLSDGYYRVMNYKTQRYVYVYDNTGKINAAAGSADVGAMDLWKNLDRTISDPGSVLYARYIGPNGKGGYSYDVEGQGTSVKSIIDYFVSIHKLSGGQYNIYASLGGFTKYLDDEETNLNLEQGMMGFSREGDYRKWVACPIDVTTDNYFGVAPTIAADGKYYQPFYAAFPFSFASEGMKALYVKTFDAAENIAVIAEATGDIPGETPLIIECSSNQPTNNRLNLLRNNDAPLASNSLAGVYFNNLYRENSADALTPYSAQTMRVLGTDAEGNLCFKKYDKTYLPANQSYLVVPEGTADVVTIMTEEEYNARFVAVADIALNSTELTLTEGDSFQLTAVVTPENATDATVTWSSSNVEVATVDEQGLVMAVAEGDAVISATANDGSGKVASCSVKVEKKIVLVSEILLNLTEATLQEGETLQLTAEVHPADATDASFAWSSSDEVVATVDQVGLVKALAAGQVVISAVANDASGISAACQITIEPAAGISAVMLDASTTAEVYTLSGVKVRTAGESLAGLKPGLYIIDGQKVNIY